MLAWEKTYNRIARSIRSKPSHFIYLVFFLRNEDKLKN